MRRAIALLLLLLASALPALEVAGVNWSERDKQAHAAAGALLAYVAGDVVERLWPSLHPALRWLVAVATTSAAAAVYESTCGVRDPEDFAATAVGGVGGATGQLGVSLLFTRDAAAAELRWRF